MKILIIDDDIMIIKALKNKLENSGYQDIVTADNGFSAIDIVQRDKIDLIISDINMPDLNGLDLLSYIKIFHDKKIPVIVISSFDNTDIVLQSLSLGAVDYYLKPINYDVLLQKINEYVL
ncbi:MAG: response regulator [Flavobacteriia bacterium]|nr:response regulator [Flavobacteriia bacterium]